MAPREIILTMTKNRMDKLNQFGGGPIPIRVKGAGKSGEFTAVMLPKNSGGMLARRRHARWDACSGGAAAWWD